MFNIASWEELSKATSCDKLRALCKPHRITFANDRYNAIKTHLSEVLSERRGEKGSDSDAPKKRKKKKKDPNAPKRNMSSYFLYSKATRNDVKAANPDATFGEIAKIISSQFKALNEEERAHWNSKAEEEKERYRTEMAAYKATLGEDSD